MLFGLAALFLPGLTLWVLIVFFGAYALVDGVSSRSPPVYGLFGTEMAPVGRGRAWRGGWPGHLLLAWHDRPGVTLRNRRLGDLHRSTRTL